MFQSRKIVCKVLVLLFFYVCNCSGAETIRVVGSDNAGIALGIDGAAVGKIATYEVNYKMTGSRIGLLKLRQGFADIAFVLQRPDEDLRSENIKTIQRINSVEQIATESQESVTTLSGRVDTLNIIFGQAADWIRALDLEGISEQASDASQAAAAIQEQNKAFLAKYLEWLQAQQSLIDEQINMIEAKMGTSATPTELSEDAPETASPDDEE